MSGAAILAFLREASSDLSSSLPSYSPSQESWSPTESGFINTRVIFNCTRRSAPRFRLKWRLSHHVSQRWRSGSSTTGFNWTQPSPMPWSLAQGRFFLGGARRLVGYRRWSCGDHGRNQNPWCSSGPILVNERPSEVVDEDLQLPHPFSPTCLPTSDFRICRDDRPRSRHFSTRLLYNSILYGTSKANIGRLQRVQNDLARVVRQAAWNSSSKPLLKHLHWLPVQQRIIFKIALVTFNVRTFEQTFYLHSLLDSYISSRNYYYYYKFCSQIEVPEHSNCRLVPYWREFLGFSGSRTWLGWEGQHLLRIPFRKSVAARRSFCSAAPTIWNSLNSSTREAASIGTFKARLKTELFLSAFQWTSTALLPCILPRSYTWPCDYLPA